MSSFRLPDRAGWAAILGASLLGLLASLAVVGIAQLVALRADPGSLVSWLVVLLTPVIGGVVAGVWTPGDISTGAGSGLLVGLSLGLIAIAVGIGQFSGVVGGDQAPAWILWGVVGTPFLLLLAGGGGVLGGVVSEIRGARRDRPETGSTAPERTADAGSPATDRDRSAAEDAVEGQKPVEGPSDAVDDPGDRAAPDWRSSLVGMGRATVEGTAATFVLGMVGLFSGPVVLGVPFFGGFVAGYRSPGRRGLGTFCGLAAGVAVVVLTLALVVLELRSQTYVGPGAVVGVVLLAVVLFFTIPLAAIGGFVGGKAGAPEESRADDDPEAPADAAES